MDFISSAADLLSIFTEGIIVIAVPAMMCRRRYGKVKNILFTVLFAAVYTGIISVVRYFELALFTEFIIAVGCSFIINILLSEGKVLLRISALSVTRFFLHTFDYIATYGVILLLDTVFEVSESTATILGAGRSRAVFLVAERLIEVLLLYLIRKVYPKMQIIGTGNLILIFVFSAGTYILMNILTGLIFGGSLLTMQLASLLCVFFIAVSFIVTVAAVSINSKYEKNKSEAALMASTNQLLDINYKKLQNSQNIIRSQLHDFKNHLRTINGMLQSDEQAKKIYRGFTQ